MVTLKIGQKFLQKNLWECERFSDRRISYQELEKTNTGQLSAKVANNQFDQMHYDDWLQNMLFYVILVITVSVDTVLGRSGKFG